MHKGRATKVPGLEKYWVVHTYIKALLVLHCHDHTLHLGATLISHAASLLINFSTTYVRFEILSSYVVRRQFGLSKEVANWYKVNCNCNTSKRRFSIIIRYIHTLPNTIQTHLYGGEGKTNCFPFLSELSIFGVMRHK